MGFKGVRGKWQNKHCVFAQRMRAKATRRCVKAALSAEQALLWMELMQLRLALWQIQWTQKILQECVQLCPGASKAQEEGDSNGDSKSQDPSAS